MTLPDVTFETRMNIHLGGKTAQLMYFGPAQDPGASFIYFPHAKALATGGSYATRSWANPMQTPSVDGWISALRKISEMDVDIFLPGHGDIGKKPDVKEAIVFLIDLQTAVKDAIAKGMSKEQAAKTLQLPKYKDWRNADRGGGQHRRAVPSFDDGEVDLPRSLSRQDSVRASTKLSTNGRSHALSRSP